MSSLAAGDHIIERHTDDAVALLLAPWRYAWGVRPHRVEGFERPERNGVVYARWWNPEKPGKDKRDKISLDLKVREVASGPIVPALVEAAEAAVRALQARLLSGLPARTAPVAPAPAGPLTMRAGFNLALVPVTGKYATTTTRRYRDMQLFRDRLFGDAGDPGPLVDPRQPWEALTAGTAQTLWRTIANRHLASDRRDYGPRAAEQLVDALYTVAAWLRQAGKIAPTAALPREGWRSRLKDDWAEITDVARPETPERPRHTSDEYRRLLKASWDPSVDPRCRLLVQLALECRLGQALRCRRRMLTLPGIPPEQYDTAEAGTLGSLRIPGSRKKRGEVVYFTADQRRAADQALATYLQNYEAAYLAGRIQDYWIFVGSRMRPLGAAGERWPRRVRPGAKPWSRDGARTAWQALEAIAGIPHVKGRGWYGMRRVATDIAEPLISDPRVKDSLGGWVNRRTRPAIYQAEAGEEVRAAAAAVRHQMRTGAATALPPSYLALVGSGVSTAQEEKLDTLLGQLSHVERTRLAQRLISQLAANA